MLLASSGNFHAAAQGPTRQHEYLLDSLRREISDKLQATGKFSSIRRIDSTTLVSLAFNGAQSSINLASLANDVAQSPSRRSELVARVVDLVAASVQPPDKMPTRDEFLASLRIVVRHASFAGGSGPAPVSKPIAGDAVAFVVTSNSEDLTLLRTGAGAPFGLTDEAMFEAATQQIQRYQTEHTTEDANQVRVFLAADEGFSPSLLLLGDMWRRVETDFGADFLVAIPDRTVLLAAPLANAAGLARTVEALMQQRKARPHISHFLQRAGAGWKRFK